MALNPKNRTRKFDSMGTKDILERWPESIPHTKHILGHKIIWKGHQQNIQVVINIILKGQIKGSYNGVRFKI